MAERGRTALDIGMGGPGRAVWCRRQPGPFHRFIAHTDPARLAARGCGLGRPPAGGGGRGVDGGGGGGSSVGGVARSLLGSFGCRVLRRCRSVGIR